MKNSISLGILLTSLSYLLFTCHDVTIKLLVDSVSVWQILFFRSLTILAGCFVLGGRSLVTRTVNSPIIRPMALRSLMLLAAWLSYYTAARDLPLAELTTLYFAAPIVATVLAVPILREVVTAPRWLAVVVGFVGVVIATDPSRLTISLPVYLALQAAVLWASGTVLLRKTAMAETSIVQMTISNLFFLALTGAMLLVSWKTPNLQELALLFGTGIIGGAAQLAFFEGMRRAPISVLAPFEYTALVWAFVLGYLVWSDIPKSEVFVGAALIISAGLIIILSERRRAISPA
ncbi:DMT family transporter [Rhizobiaceae bacterium n13]|uniref:DMT family transporter n=1 Tax=Ferirhizobium litorale TaxID=2927786 RepID=A0AAE3U1H4_9HYPH|nr:DMT family transporter [Fererhizobium litorale]MDI7864851.1 DMT family transporter [Fererhizobium litorale]MDI7923139.1 DMT family transporter [Fererhizobium litorale]